MAERPEDLNLPTSVVGRIIKEALPANVNVSKDARLALSKAASVFILYATSCANNFAMQTKRKTISSQDVYEAMNEMEYGEFVDPLKQNLGAFKNNQKDKKEQSDKKKKEVTEDSEEKMEEIEEISDAENEELDAEP